MGRIAQALGLPQPSANAGTGAQLDAAEVRGRMYGFDVDTTTGAPAGLRADLSMSTSMPEKLAKLQARYPQGAVQQAGEHLLFKEDARNREEPFKTVEDIGVTSFGDVADSTRDIAQASADVALYTIFPGLALAKPAAQAGIGFLTGAGGHALMEGIEQLRGKQMDSAATVAKDSAKQGMWSGAFNYGISKLGLIDDAMRGAGALDMTDEERFLLKKMDASPLGEHVSIAPLRADSPVWRRFTMQSKSLSKTAQDRLLKGQQAGTDYLQSLSESKTPHQIGGPLRQELRKLVSNEESRIMQSVPPLNEKKITLESGGKLAQSALSEDFVKKSRDMVATLYKELDAVAQIEKPVFATSDLKQQVAKIRQKLEGYTVGGQVNVPIPPELSQSLQAIEEMPKYVSDYNILKNIRTNLWDAIDNQPWQWDGGKKLALEAWGALSDTIKRPVRAAGTPTNGTQYQFLDKFEEASGAAKERFQVFENAQIRSIMNTDKPVTIARALARDGNMTEEVSQVMEQWAPEKFNQVRASIQNFWVTDPANRGKLGELLETQKTLYPESYRRIVGGNAEQSALEGVAVQLDRLNSPQMKATLDRHTQAGHVVRKLMDEQDEEGLDYLVKLSGGKDSKAAQYLKTGLLEDLLNKSTKENKGGALVIDHGAFSKQLREWQRSGTLEKLFNKQDVENMFMLKHYTRLFNAVLEDAGTSLSAAGTVNSLLHPSSFTTGMHSIVVSKMMGWAMTSPTARKLLLGTGEQRKPFLSGRITANVLAAFNNDVNGGDASLGQFYESQAQEPLQQSNGGEQRANGERNRPRPSEAILQAPR